MLSSVYALILSMTSVSLQFYSTQSCLYHKATLRRTLNEIFFSNFAVFFYWTKLFLQFINLTSRPIRPHNTTCWATADFIMKLFIALIFNDCYGSAMSFELRRMLRRDEYLMRESADVGEEDVFVFVGRTKSRKSCHRLVARTDVGS